jgi:maltose-binding protein MalE
LDANAKENHMLRKLAFVFVTLGLLGTVTPALAQKIGPNGGLLAGKGSHQTELLVSSTELTVYILHDGKTDDTDGVAIRAVVQEGGKTTTIDFANQNGKRLVAKLAAPLGKGAIVVLTGKDHHGDAITARYVVN